jgi:hypothetical protein
MTIRALLAVAVVVLVVFLLVYHPCQLSIGNVCLVRGMSAWDRIVAAQDQVSQPTMPDPAAFVGALRRQSPAKPSGDYVPVTHEEFANCPDDECRENLCGIAVEHGQFKATSEFGAAAECWRNLR